MAVANTLAYYDTATITVVNSFMVHAAGSHYVSTVLLSLGGLFLSLPMKTT